MPEQQQSKKGCKKAGRNKNKRSTRHLLLAERRKIRHIAENNIPRFPRTRHCGMEMEQLPWEHGRSMHGVFHLAHACKVCKKVKWLAPSKQEPPANKEERWVMARELLPDSRKGEACFQGSMT